MNPEWNKFLEEAQKIQQKMQEAQKELAELTITGTAGAGLVEIIISGRLDVKKVKLDDSLLKEPKNIIEELIAAAMNDAIKRAEASAKGKLSPFGALANFPFNPFK